MINVYADKQNQSIGRVLFNNKEYFCVLGRGGLISSSNKKEGDGATPIGSWLMRRVFYRADKIKKPKTNLPVQKIKLTDAWCDFSGCDDYNTLVTLPHNNSYEDMWRNDDLYDLVVELGYNDNPVIKNKGSAIFMHVMHADKTPTAGCIAMSIEDLSFILSECEPLTLVIVNKI